MTTQPFQQLTPTAAFGAPTPPGWQSLQESPLCILVGLTGVGKSSLVNELLARQPALQFLPDRRILTDQLIIAQIQHDDGEPVTHVHDRSRRFAYTRRYRARYPGGMAHALSRLLIAPTPEQTAPERNGKTIAPRLFDGLRGANEVTHAAALLPQATFVLLDAPDWVRVQRLLDRQDEFDRITVPTGHAPPAPVPTTLEALGVADAIDFLSPGQASRLLDWVAAGEIGVDDLRAKLQIVIEERRNYDPGATRRVLTAHYAHRTLILDTVSHPPHVLAAQLLDWLEAPAQRPAQRPTGYVQ